MAWCKQRALEYCDAGELVQAIASMSSDLRKHPETRDDDGIKAALLLMMSGSLNTPYAMRAFIEGFN